MQLPRQILLLPAQIHAKKQPMMFAGEKNYRKILQSELEKRCEKNSRYSLRAFARDLEMGPARLSEILNARTGLSKDRAEALAIKLGFSDEEKEVFSTLVESEHARSKINRHLAKTKLSKHLRAPYSSMDVDYFKVISDWYHFAILELTEIKGFKSDARWIAASLGITEIEAKLALERLVRLGYLKLKRKKYVTTEDLTQTASAAPSESIRKFHRQILNKAIEAIDLQSLEQRQLGAMVMSVHRKDLPELKRKIKAFRQELNQFAVQNPEKDSVYCFSTQLFELSTIGEKK